MHVFLAGHDHICWDQKPSKDSPETHHLTKTVIDLLLYYKKSKSLRSSPFARTEQNHLRRRSRRLDNGSGRHAQP